MRFGGGPMRWRVGYYEVMNKDMVNNQVTSNGKTKFLALCAE
jgi:hypothetical protein